jgi:hypothetical protein
MSPDRARGMTTRELEGQDADVERLVGRAHFPEHRGEALAVRRPDEPGRPSPVERVGLAAVYRPRLLGGLGDRQPLPHLDSRVERRIRLVDRPRQELIEVVPPAPKRRLGRFLLNGAEPSASSLDVSSHSRDVGEQCEGLEDEESVVHSLA